MSHDDFNWDNSGMAAENNRNDAMQNTEQKSTVVDPGMHRREARRLLIGKKGLTKAEKIERMQRAMDHLSEAITLTIESDEEE